MSSPPLGVDCRELLAIVFFRIGAVTAPSFLLLLRTGTVPLGQLPLRRHGWDVVGDLENSDAVSNDGTSLGAI